ncbi:hypothetical protein [Streptomyces beigongshangae]|uniref:hypothetical protein n=1 Tax=Streptomyces beigongshangae TaxID=2841597 RepID=UPI001C84348B|nr:hypothetical protein [Streptomyces sp. REN17]
MEVGRLLEAVERAQCLTGTMAGGEGAGVLTARGRGPVPGRPAEQPQGVPSTPSAG